MKLFGGGRARPRLISLCIFPTFLRFPVLMLVVWRNIHAPGALSLWAATQRDSKTPTGRGNLSPESFLFSYLRDESGSVHPSQRKQHFFSTKKIGFLGPAHFSRRSRRVRAGPRWTPALSAGPAGASLRILTPGRRILTAGRSILKVFEAFRRRPSFQKLGNP